MEQDATTKSDNKPEAEAAATDPEAVEAAKKAAHSPPKQKVKDSGPRATIIASIIGGVATIGAALLTFFLTQYTQTMKYVPQSAERQVALVGVWEGEEMQYIGLGKDPMKIYARLALDISGRKVIGEYYARLDGPPKREATFLVEGGFLENRFLQLDYRCKDRSKAYFGSILLILNAEGNQLEGQVVGYSGPKGIIGASTLKLIRNKL